MSAEDLRRNMSALSPTGPDETAVGASYSVAEPDLLAGLVTKAATSDASAKTYLPFPPDVVEKYGLPGVDARFLSFGEKILLRKMGISTVPPRPERVSPKMAALKSRIAAAQAAPGVAGGGAGSTNWTKYIVSSMASPQPSRVSPDGKTAWLHYADIPPSILGKLTPEQRKEYPITGMRIPLDEITPEENVWLGQQVADWRAKKEADAANDVQNDPRALRKLMGM